MGLTGSDPQEERLGVVLPLLNILRRKLERTVIRTVHMLFPFGKTVVPRRPQM